MKKYIMLLLLLALPGILNCAVQVTVVGKPSHRISKYIYGINGADEGMRRAGLVTVDRPGGGNPSSTYNWEINCNNGAGDWFFQNRETEDYVPLIVANKQMGVETLITVPSMGWVSKDKSSYSFSTADYPMMQSETDYTGGQWGNPDMGRGGRHKGGGKDNVEKYGGDHPIPAGYPPIDDKLRERAYVRTTTKPKPGNVKARYDGDDLVYLDEWLQHLMSRETGPDSVMFYATDNEPFLWPSTHYDIVPEPMSYQRFYAAFEQHALMIKRRDPNAVVIGPPLWGFMAYTGDSAKEDKARYGEFIPWFLDKCKAYEQKHGLRILDVLSCHYYPQDGTDSWEAGDATRQRTRHQGLRSLYDKSFLDASWIGRDMKQGIYLVPRMREAIAKHYPGTKSASTEYHLGGWFHKGRPHMSGLLAQGEALGVFGREGLFLSTGFAFPRPHKAPGLVALYTVFRKHYGDYYCPTSSSDPDLVAAFTAYNSKDKRTYLVVINKDPENAQQIELKLSGCKLSAADVAYWRMTDAGKKKPEQGSAKLDIGAPVVELPPYSLSSFRLALEYGPGSK